MNTQTIKISLKPFDMKPQMTPKGKPSKALLNAIESEIAGMTLEQMLEAMANPAAVSSRVNVALSHKGKGI